MIKEQRVSLSNKPSYVKKNLKNCIIVAIRMTCSQNPEYYLLLCGFFSMFFIEQDEHCGLICTKMIILFSLSEKMK